MRSIAHLDRAGDGTQLTFNADKFKQAFREAALRRGEDPVTRQKISSFEAALKLAELHRDLHYSRQRELVRMAAERQAARCTFPTEGRGFLKSDFSIDEQLVTQAESKGWWAKLDPADWSSGCDGSIVERRAFSAIRRDIKSKQQPESGEEHKPDITEAIDVMNEVFYEMHLESPASINEEKKSKEISRKIHV